MTDANTKMAKKSTEKDTVTAFQRVKALLEVIRGASGGATGGLYERDIVLI